MSTPPFTSFAAELEAAFRPDELDEIGRVVGFTKRRRVITSARLVTALVWVLGALRVESIADLLRGFNQTTGTATAYKAFWCRLARPEFVALMKAVVQRCLDRLAVKTLEFDEDSPFRRFKDIRIQDGSSFAVKQSLSGAFPGRFTTVEPAAVEVHGEFSAIHDEVVRVSLTADSASERAELPEPHTLKDCLLLGDRGYPGTDYFKALDAAGGFYIMRLTKSWKPQVHGEYAPDGEVRPLNKPMSLDQFAARNLGRVLDLSISLAKDGHKSRFRLVMVPNTSTNPKKKDDWIRLCTNLPAADFPSELVARAYRFRWQIELVFKEWKSYANLHKFDSGNASIVEGLIWASLCAAIVKRFVAHAAQNELALPVSTRRTAMLMPYFLEELMCGILQRDDLGLGRAWRKTIAFIAANGLRSNPKRDREKGRLRMGLREVAMA